MKGKTEYPVLNIANILDESRPHNQPPRGFKPDAVFNAIISEINRLYPKKNTSLLSDSLQSAFGLQIGIVFKNFSECITCYNQQKNNRAISEQEKAQLQRFEAFCNDISSFIHVFFDINSPQIKLLSSNELAQREAEYIVNRNLGILGKAEGKSFVYSLTRTFKEQKQKNDSNYPLIVNCETIRGVIKKAFGNDEEKINEAYYKYKELRKKSQDKKVVLTAEEQKTMDDFNKFFHSLVELINAQCNYDSEKKSLEIKFALKPQKALQKFTDDICLSVYEYQSGYKEPESVVITVKEGDKLPKSILKKLPASDETREVRADSSSSRGSSSSDKENANKKVLTFVEELELKQGSHYNDGQTRK